ncbi:AAA family ATPase [Paenibacillus senegalensis]|uniref:AAA family ATPase n=1 Tax=Paenibacillus senegalensis TaxID=1465766 RepID=UPI00028821E9|nr:MoxR family ATPase [Paenibacillus senegalensis]
MSLTIRRSIFTDQPEEILQQMIESMEQAVIGKRDAIELLMIAVICGGHVLMEDVPGVGKTTLVRALAKTIDCRFKRLQFTPDLLPADITGVSILNRQTNEFEFREGPLFSNIVLADELNRASPKTQSALLEAMEEKHVSVDGITFPLPVPFLLLATQNPIEYEGTYPLPEAQLDRFLIRIRLGYPSAAHEAEMLGRNPDRHPLDRVRPVIEREQLKELQRRVRSVHVDESVKQYIVELVSATRHHQWIALGASPRASLALMHASQARALLMGRGYVLPDDVKQTLSPVVAHRLRLTAEARINRQHAEGLLNQIVNQVHIPGLPRIGKGTGPS